MKAMRFGLMRVALFGSLVLGGLLLHIGQTWAAEPEPPLTTSVRAQAAKARVAIRSELAVQLRKDTQAQANHVTAERLATVAAALEAAATAAPVQSMVLAPIAYGAVNYL